MLQAVLMFSKQYLYTVFSPRYKLELLIFFFLNKGFQNNVRINVESWFFLWFFFYETTGFAVFKDTCTGCEKLKCIFKKV